MNLTHVSGIPTPTRGILAAYTNAAGTLTVMRPDGSIVSAEPGTVNFSGLLDMVAPWSSGQTPNRSGSTFVQGPTGTALANTIYTSGQIEIMDLLYSGVVPDGGTPAAFTWSGIDQTYTDLELRGVARAQAAGTVFYISIYFNNDLTAGNYASRSLNYGGTVTHTTNADSTPSLCQGLNQLDVNIGSQSPVHIEFPNYSSVGFRKYFNTVGVNVFNQVVSSSTSMDIRPVGCQWLNTTGPAINMMDVRINNATTTFCSGTALYLYGKKKIWIITSGTYGTAPVINGRFA
jgi:hypothetical protein